MKKILITIAAVMVAVAAQAGTFTKYIQTPMTSDVGNWYVAAYSGMSVYQTGIRNIDEQGNRLHQSRKIGVNGGLKFGYDFAPEDWVRPVLELDVMYNHYRRNIEEATFISNSFSYMVNALAKFNCGNWQPYGGFGIGMYTMHMRASALGDKACDWKNGFAWALIGGVDYNLDLNWALFAEYKWLNYQVSTAKDFLGDDAKVVKSRIGQQIVNMGVRYQF